MEAFKITKKEIKKESIGQQLKKARTAKNISYETAEEATKIKLKYLKAMEEDNFNVFSSPVYAQGFLKSYAQYLGLPYEPLIAQYKSETGIAQAINKKLFPPKKEVRPSKIYITPTTIFIILLAIVVIGVLAYIGYQVSGFAGAPYLVIESPNYGATVSQDSITVVGKTLRGASLYINGQLLPIDNEGKFRQAVKLKEGENNILISAVNKAGRKTEKELVIIYKSEGR
jgi:transcriptional regulator with XRE-family HTH domain